MPLLTAGDFLIVFFFSFLGRIVSELGFVLRLPLVPCGPAPCSWASWASWGIDVTVSVSTVMLCNGTSVLLLEMVCLIEAVDCLVVSGGGAAAVAPDRISILVLPVSLPLSFAGELAFSGWEVEISEMMLLSSSFSNASSKSCCFGDVSGLAS